ncbi:MAG TPA: lamin tail domain-containing protein [Saprospiraceae bacterium]|nr:lamin tail domain-containing protein [Saprospiraceae bacterium]HMQ83582.1 lamin tail domain-containing protein [Saprospiraceae bacterium]
MRHISFFILALALMLGHQAAGQIIASQDFESPLNLNGTTATPTLNSFSDAGDAWGVYSFASTTALGIRDDSGASCTSTAFPTDNQGFIGCDFVGNYFGIVDLENNDFSGQANASWSFNIAGATDMTVCIDMAAMGDFESTGDAFNFFYSIDGNTPTPLFTSSVNEAGNQGYTMDDGDVFTLDDPLLMNGVLLDENFQTFSKAIAGTGSVLTIILFAQNDGGTEAFALDNIVIKGTPGGGTSVDLPYCEMFETNDRGVGGACGTAVTSCMLNDFSDVNWTIEGADFSLLTATTDYFKTVNGMLEARDAESANGICWVSPIINIAGAPSVDISVDITESDSHEETDFVDVYYIVDGVPMLITNFNGLGNASHTLIDDFTSATVTASGISGINLVIQICVKNNADAERIRIDNVKASEGQASCNISSVEISNVSSCNDNGTEEPLDDSFTFDITVNYANAPGGDLVIFDQNDNLLLLAPQGTYGPNSYTFSNVLLNADGQSFTFTASFAALEGDCEKAFQTPAVAPCSLPGCTLVINEIDYDQPSTDNAEFVEIYNPCTEPMNLDRYDLVFINGSNNSIYLTVNLPNVMLAPGDYFVVCANAANTPNCDLQVSPSTNLIQNGDPDAVALLFGNSIADALSYEGSVPGYVEGSGSGLFDSAAPGIGIGRLPDGADTDQNNVDFVQQCITPGAPNSGGNEYCSLPDGFDVCEIGCDGLVTAEFDANADVFEVSSTCYNYQANYDRITVVGTNVCGNGEISAKIASVLPSNGFAGITIRENDTPGSRMFSVIRHPNGQKYVTYRNNPNAAYSFFWFPIWTIYTDYVRITREGNLFKAYVSYTGAPGTWQLIFAQYINMQGCAKYGLQVSSFANGAITVAEFSEVNVIGSNPGLAIDNSGDQAAAPAGGAEFVSGDTPNLPATPVTVERADFTVYPNPAVDQLHVTFDAFAAEEALVKISNLEGKELFAAKYEVAGNTITLELADLKLAAGLYVVTVTSGEEVFTTRFVKSAE